VPDIGEVPRDGHDSDPDGRPPRDPRRTPVLRYRRGKCAQYRHGAVAHADVNRPRNRRGRPAPADGCGETCGDEHRRADVADCEGNDQTRATPEQFGEPEQAEQGGQPQRDRAGIYDECAKEQRPEVSVTQVVEIGTGVPEHAILRDGTKRRQCDVDAKQD